MKLNEIKQVNESSTPIHMTMILQEVIKAGKVTNMIQYVILAQLVEMFKYAAQRDNQQSAEYVSGASPRYVYEFPTPKQIYDELKSLDDKDKVNLAKWCLSQLSASEVLENNAKWCNPQMGLAQWIQWVNQKQD